MKTENIINESEERYLVEQEIEKPGEHLKLMDNPFDPTLINIDTKTQSMDTIISRIAHKDIEMNTTTYFQRKDDLWDKTKQSRLIESILIRFPLPAFYFDASEKKWLVVDGLQRLSSIRNFAVTKNLKLTNLEFLPQLEGKGFDDLEYDLQRIIKETQVVLYLINPGTPADVKFNIFKRINTGGLVLEPQEIRHALFQGAPAEFVAELGILKEFKEATTNSLKNNNRMLDRDFATRFLCFYLLGYENYMPDLDTFMSKAMAAVYNFSKEQKDKIKDDYIHSLKLNRDVFGDNAFRKIDVNQKIRKPINKAVFDVFSVQFALLNEKERNNIKDNKQYIIDGFLDLLNKDEAFFWSVSSATGDKNRVFYRHSTIKKLIQQVLNL
jgi:hypothetical protein